MGEVIALIRVMPTEMLTDKEIQTMTDTIKKTIKAPVKLGRVEVKDIAFGLRGLNVTVVVPDSAGGLDPIVDQLAAIKKVESVEVTDVGRI